MTVFRMWRRGLAVCVASLACGSEVVVNTDAGVGGASTVTTEASLSDASAEVSSSDAGATVVGAEASASAEAVAVSSSASGLAPDACVLACKNVAACSLGSSTASCEAGCAAVAPACAPAHQAWLQCIITNGFPDAAGCPAIAACEPLLWPYLLCAGGCVGGSCGSSPSGSCGCQSNCVGSLFETSCFPGDPGLFGCKCIQNGVVVGTCFGPGTSKSCDAIRSCCSGVFFVDG